MTSNVTWILVGDGARARLFETASPDDALTELACFANPGGRLPGRAFMTSRVHESLCAGRSSVGPQMRERMTDRFARTICDELERGRDAQRYVRLVIVAPPPFLGALHGAFSKQLRECVAAEIKRNVTALHASDIRAHIPRRLYATAPKVA